VGRMELGAEEQSTRHDPRTGFSRPSLGLVAARLPQRDDSTRAMGLVKWQNATWCSTVTVTHPRAAALFCALAIGCGPVHGRVQSMDEADAIPGHVVGATGDAGFVSHPQTVYALKRQALIRLRSDGGPAQVLLEGVKDARLSPSGHRLLVRRATDLLIQDLGTSAVRKVPTSLDDVTRYGWTEASDQIWVEHTPRAMVIESTPRVERFDVGAPEPSREPEHCPAGSAVAPMGCGEIRVGQRAVARIAGCRGGRRFPRPDACDFHFAEDCTSLLFGYDGQIFVVELSTNQVAQLTTGLMVGVVPLEAQAGTPVR